MYPSEEADWRKAILSAIKTLGHRYEKLYSDRGQLQHFDRLMVEMHRRFGDPALARAAFLHGIPPENLRALEKMKTLRARVGEEELAILREWEQLRQLNPAEKGFANRLRNKILPDLQDVRSAILLVCERLDRLDPKNYLGHWATIFRRRPLVLAPAPTLPENTFERFFPTSFLDFAGKVAAPIAHALGLWQERIIIRNAVLYFKAPERFLQLVSFAIECSRLSTWCDDHVTTVRGELRKAFPGAAPDFDSEFRWEWRHVASLAEQLEGVPRTLWGQKAHLCGFVSIICPNAEACYRVLGKVHISFKFQLKSFRDSLGEPTSSGYQALHTLVAHPKEEDRYLALRMLPRESENRRFALAGARLLAQHRASKRSATGEIIAVTPKGPPRFLPNGATVLNFASAVNRTWVAHVRGALLNGENEVGVLHPLRSRDTVTLHLVEEPQVPPNGWEQEVPAETRSRIREGFREAFRPTLERAGLEYVRGELRRLDVDEEIVKVFVESGLADLLREHPDFPGNGAAWWCRQLGLLQLEEKGTGAPFELKLTRAQAESLIEKVKARVNQLRVRDSVLEVDPRRASVTIVRRCPQCKPGRRSQLAFNIRAGTLTIHRRGERCAQGADLIHRKLLSLDQYFVIEVINRPGMAKEVLAVFADKNVDVVEMVARRLASTWGVARIEVEPIGPATVRRIEEDLLALEDVKRVFCPGDTIPQVFRSTLPPRLDVPRSPLSRPPPYICGPVIYDHHYFYGRESEMNRLYHLLDRATPAEAPAGVMVFVCGPLKVGKTSLVRRFQRQLELRQDQEFPFISLYHKTRVHDSWKEVEAALASQIKRKVGEMAKYWGMPEFSLRHNSLQGRLAEVTALESKPMVVVAIDEVVRMFKNTQEKAPRLVTAIQDFREFIDRTPGVMVILIGPLAPARNLAPALRDILTSSEPMSVSPFTWAETKAMLTAEKLAPIHQIELPEQVARSVQALTAGDPFWTAHLGNAIWRQSENGSEGPRRFNAKAVQQASAELAQQSTLFQGRIFPNGLRHERDHLIRAILFLLVRAGNKRARKRPGMSSGQLRKALHLRGVEPSPEELEHSLEELSERGGVSRAGAGLDRWRISAPLLAKHLKYHFEKTGWKAGRQ